MAAEQHLGVIQVPLLFQDLFCAPRRFHLVDSVNWGNILSRGPANPFLLAWYGTVR